MKIKQHFYQTIDSWLFILVQNRCTRSYLESQSPIKKIFNLTYNKWSLVQELLAAFERKCCKKSPSFVNCLSKLVNFIPKFPPLCTNTSLFCKSVSFQFLKKWVLVAVVVKILFPNWGQRCQPPHSNERFNIIIMEITEVEAGLRLECRRYFKPLSFQTLPSLKAAWPILKNFVLNVACEKVCANLWYCLLTLFGILQKINFD